MKKIISGIVAAFLLLCVFAPAIHAETVNQFDIEIYGFDKDEKVNYKAIRSEMRERFDSELMSFHSVPADTVNECPEGEKIIYFIGPEAVGETLYFMDKFAHKTIFLDGCVCPVPEDMNEEKAEVYANTYWVPYILKALNVGLDVDLYVSTSDSAHALQSKKTAELLQTVYTAENEWGLVLEQAEENIYRMKDTENSGVLRVYYLENAYEEIDMVSFAVDCLREYIGAYLQ